jgi:hypothetical protein
VIPIGRLLGVAAVELQVVDFPDGKIVAHVWLLFAVFAV